MITNLIQPQLISWKTWKTCPLTSQKTNLHECSYTPKQLHPKTMIQQDWLLGKCRPVSTSPRKKRTSHNPLPNRSKTTLNTLLNLIIEVSPKSLQCIDSHSERSVFCLSIRPISHTIKNPKQIGHPFGVFSDKNISPRPTRRQVPCHAKDFPWHIA